jgi:hypothetical protein
MRERRAALLEQRRLPVAIPHEYTHKYIMPTSVHIPKPLLIAVDRKARALRISRNRLIVQALEREMTQGSDWSPDFFAQLALREPAVDAAADEMLRAIRSQRRSKKPVTL